MRKFIFIFLIAGLIFTFSLNSEPAGKQMKGKVAGLNSLMFGKPDVNSSKAVKLAEIGQPIVFYSGGRVYFVINQGGAYIGKKLAKHADADAITITGKTKRVNGINFLIADSIEPVS